MSEAEDFQKNSTLEEILMQKTNLEYLEFILYKESLLLKDVIEKESCWKIGPVVKKYKQLRAVFEEVKPVVDNSLVINMLKDHEPKLSLGRIGAFKTNFWWNLPLMYVFGSGALKSAIAFPAIVQAAGLLTGVLAVAIPAVSMWAYFNLVTFSQDFYSYKGRRLNVKKNIEEEVKVTIAHEYTHFLQHLFGIHNKILSEGHARGVERKIACIYEAQENNSVYLYSTVLRSLCELKTEYEFLCKKLGAKKADWIELIEVPSSKTLFGNPTHYAKGVALFRIAEEKFPRNNVYAEVLRKDFSHLKI